MLIRIAEVCINVQASRLRHPFSYLIPQEFSYLDVGWRVVVPFGSSASEGFILETRMPEPNEEFAALKSVRDVPDDEPWFDDEMLKTARWLSEYYVCSLGEALRLFIPGKSGVKSEIFYRVSPESKPPENLGFVYDFIKMKGLVSFQRLRSEFGASCRTTLAVLLKEGFIISSRQTRQRVTEKWTRSLSLAVSLEEAETIISTWKGKPAQKRLLENLLQFGSLPIANKQGGIAWDSAAKSLVLSGLACENKLRLQRDSYFNMNGSCSEVTATHAQQAALDQIIPSVRDKIQHTFLLYGVTGSGKTEVYLRAAACALEVGRQVLVLIPEIAQTSQLLRRFKARFGADVAVAHSRLSVSERRDVWDLFRNREINIVIGTRSALFLPGAHLGLIIVDEEHEFSYKQEESPRYHVRETALKRASLLGATLLLGSATPALESYHAAMNGSYTMLEMPERVDGSSLPVVEIVDMREQLKQGRKSVVSVPLEQLLMETKEKGEQAILLLNRRGHSTFVSCRECGYVMRCPHCSVPLVFHMNGGTLRCHYCNSNHSVPNACPSCHGKYIRYFGAGTQRLEEELISIMPGVRLTRMDKDTTGGKTGHDSKLDTFRAGNTDILLGTQMVAKGHDIENVTAVGILAADSSLNLPDFRAAERSFALVMQAAGRAGRGSKAGRVVVQTYHPGHYALMAGAAQDYAAFYRQEIDFRRQLNYPPFSQLIKLTTTGRDESRTMKSAEETAALLLERFGLFQYEVEIMGPYVAPVSKIEDVFRVHTMIRGRDLSPLKKLLVETGIAWSRDVIVDVDPLGMM